MNRLSTLSKVEQCLDRMPIVAILRGVKPHEVVEIGQAIYQAGISIIEVPLNSPEPVESIQRLSQALGEECVIGCGTLVNKSDVKKVAEAGAQIVVTPNVNPAIIRECLKLGMVPAPGWSTPTEAFAAYQAGARILKLFPAGSYAVGHVKAVRAVLPQDVRVLAVGGVGSANAAEWFANGIDGLGIGSEIYSPNLSAADVAERARKIVAAVHNAVR